ncbi:MAG: response regulator transcription factor [Chloroflexi bacterium]|nr:response regulator transcription factor [Chloroflexota bacterium]
MTQSRGSNRIRVMIVDDHQTLRRGLRSLLLPHDDIEVVGEAADGTAAVQAAAELAPHIILLDIKMLGVDGIEIASQLAAKAPNSKVIILTAYDSDEYTLRAFQAGAYAYLLKSGVDETVVDAIREAHSGKRLLSPDLMDQVLRQFQTLARSRPMKEAGLSSEELSVLRLIAEGATNEEIAKQKYWSARTAKRKVEEIVAKLGAKNRAQAAAEAVRKGLI